MALGLWMVEAPGRSIRWLLRAGAVGVGAVLLTVLPGPGRASAVEGDSGQANPAPSASRVDLLPSGDVGPSASATSVLPSAAGPAINNAPAIRNVAPTRGVTVVANDLTLGDSYWAGGGGAGGIAITVTSNATVPQAATITFALPAGVHAVGCACVNPDLKPKERWLTELRLTIDPDAWRHSPLRGRVTVSVPGATATDDFLTVLPPGPPTPGIRLAVTDLSLTGDPTTAVGGYLMVQFGNTGSSPAGAALEVVTPNGTDVTAVGPECRSHRRLAEGRERCELGSIAPGGDHTVTFALSITPQAGAGSPLDGTVFGYFTPAGQDTATVQAAYRITVKQVGVAVAPPPEADVNGDVVAGASADEGGLSAGLASRRIRALPIVLTVVGLVLLVACLALVSLRRRLQDDIAPIGQVDDAAVQVTSRTQPATRR
jgi:hypothetical protein